MQGGRVVIVKHSFVRRLCFVSVFYADRQYFYACYYLRFLHVCQYVIDQVRENSLVHDFTKRAHYFHNRIDLAA